MEKILEYLKANPQYITALIITAVVLILACVLGYFIVKYNLLAFTDKWFKKKQPLPPEKNQGNDTSSTVQKTEPIDDMPPVPKKSGISVLLESSVDFDKHEDFEEERKIVVKPQAPKFIPEEEIPQEPQELEVIEGKWRIIPHGSTYTSELYNESGSLLLKSQSYQDVSGAKTAIDTLKKNIEGNNFTIMMKQGKFFFKLLSPSGRLICNGEPVTTRQACIERIEEVKRIAFTAEIVKG